MTTRTPFALKLAIVFLSCLLVFAGVLGFLWSLLSEYEKTTPRNYINEYVDLIKSGDFKSAMELSGIEDSQFFSVNEYEKYVREKLRDFNNLDIYETTSANTLERNFQLKGSGSRPIEFILTKSDIKLKYNFTGYKLKQKPIEGLDYTIHLPKGQIPIVNSIPLDESFIIDNKSIVLAYDSLKDKTLIPTIVTYQVKNLAFRPELSVKNFDESKYLCQFTSDNIAQITLIPDEASKNQYEKLAIDCAKTYAKYISRDVEFNELKGYIYENTSFYQSIKGYSNVWTVEHNTPVFENLTVKNTVEYSKDQFQTEVSFDYVMTKGNIKKVYPTKYILSFIKIGTEFKLANLQSL